MHRSVLRGIALILVAIAVIAALLLIPKPKPKHPPNDDPWVLVNYDPNEKYGTYLSNGFISTRIMGDGVGSQDGKPLPCYMAGLYDDEKLIPTPTWSDLQLCDEGGRTAFVIDPDEDYAQTLSMRTGVLSTRATWRLGFGRKLVGEIQVIVSRQRPGVGVVRAVLTPSRDMTVGVREPTFSARRELISVGVRDSGCDSFVTEHGRIGLGVASSTHYDLLGLPASVQGPFMPENGADFLTLKVRAGHRFAVTRYVSMAMSVEPEAAYKQARTALKSAELLGSALFSEHKAAWAKLWRKDIIVEGSRKDQQAIHSCMFNLLQSVREGSQWSIPPMGLSNNAFSGHVFWDADIWMFPALILQHPELAKPIVDYRYNTLPGAMANAKASGFAGAEYAWESGFTGKEDTPPGLVYRHERHINGDVALCQWQYYLATGDTQWLKSRGFPVIKATADYWVSRAKLNPAKNCYEILHVVPPDENAELVNNSVYTNVIAAMNLKIAAKAAGLVGAPANPKWADIAARMYIPFDPAKKRFVAFDGYKGLDAKQADTELVIYPLQYKMGEEPITDIYKNTFDYYAPKVMKGGPAMTASAHSVIAARLGDRSRAYSEFVKSYKPFLRGPFAMFNEKRSIYLDNMCFLTGAAGPIQATIFGLGGARMDYFGSPELTWSPCLPKQWKSLKITGVQWRGKSFDVTVLPGKGAITKARK